MLHNFLVATLVSAWLSGRVFAGAAVDFAGTAAGNAAWDPRPGDGSGIPPAPVPAAAEDASPRVKMFLTDGSGREIEAEPAVVDGKKYYERMPNAKFRIELACPARSGTWAVCVEYSVLPEHGGHIHSKGAPGYRDWSGKPVPARTCYDKNASGAALSVRYQAPDIGTRIERKAVFTGACAGSVLETDEIMVPGLVPLLPAYEDGLNGGVTYYVLIGTTSTHPVNHFGAPRTVELIKKIAWAYYSEFGTPIAVNDMSLARGGVFDLGPLPGCISGSTGKACEFWKPPHNEHRYGRQADVRSYGLTSAQHDRLLKIACGLGVAVLVEKSDDTILEDYELRDIDSILRSTGHHFHFRFPGDGSAAEAPPDALPSGCP